MVKEWKKDGEENKVNWTIFFIGFFTYIAGFIHGKKFFVKPQVDAILLKRQMEDLDYSQGRVHGEGLSDHMRGLPYRYDKPEMTEGLAIAQMYWYHLGRAQGRGTINEWNKNDWNKGEENG